MCTIARLFGKRLMCTSAQLGLVSECSLLLATTNSFCAGDSLNGKLGDGQVAADKTFFTNIAYNYSFVAIEVWGPDHHSH